MWQYVSYMETNHTQTVAQEDRPIAGAVTLRKASARLMSDDRIPRATAAYVKGAAESNGIALFPVGNSLCMTESQFQQLRSQIIAARRLNA